MNRIWILLFLSISTLANAQVEGKNGFFHYHLVFIGVNDFGEEYFEEITKSPLRIAPNMIHRKGITENPTIYETSFGSKLIRTLICELDGKIPLFNPAGKSVSFEFLM
jgi:hypothetical protein